MRPKSHMDGSSLVQFGFAGRAFLLVLAQKMILTRVRKNHSFGRWARLSCLSFLGLLWAYDALRTCSVAESVQQTELAFTNAQQILDLGIDKARNTSAPAVITGVLTFPVPDRAWAFVQDSTAGILVAYTNSGVQPWAGERVKVTGHVGAGLLAPIIRRATLETLGQTSLPQPRKVSAASLAAGESFGQWVELDGAVRDVARDMSRLFIFVSSAGIRFHAVINSPEFSTLPADWLDARVRLRGVCWTDVDRESKPAGFTLYLPGTNTITFLRPGSSNIFSAPVLSETARTNLNRQSDSRLKFSGVVLFHSPAGEIFFQDTAGPVQARLLVPLAKASPNGIYLERPPLTPLAAGTEIELVGAPREAAFAPVLQDAELRVTGKANSPTPLRVSAPEALSGRYDRELITLKGRVLGHGRREGESAFEEVLLLQNGNVTYEAMWANAPTNALVPVRQNALVQLTGLCLTQPGGLNKAASFRVLLRDPGDLRVLGQALPWADWPVDRILWIAGLLGAAALAWIWFLRRRVAQRTVELVEANTHLQTEITQRQRAQADLGKALEAERELGELKSRFVSMVSHEFRTPLGIIMSSSEILRNYQDRLTAEKKGEHLNDIFQSTRRMGDLIEEVLLLSRVEAGRLGCKPEPLDLGDLCRRLSDETLSATQQRCPIVFKEHGSTSGACADEALLRHIFGNLLSNAVKYSHPGTPVEFTVERQGMDAVFVIRDRGIGIPEADIKLLFQPFHRARNVGEVAGSGLGLVIVQRCVELHGGSIKLESTEGVGTSVTVWLGLFSKAP
jgi:signal transduction histidine kinase